VHQQFFKNVIKRTAYLREMSLQNGEDFERNNLLEVAFGSDMLS
jgi:hypothetical protein